ncbi:hypothetical protein [Chryseobacterium herbae]|uniref:Integrase catalytic domain-containing protein n=1 Tax=Chryseobacterium herbae TaxID=2976476 RepID=A0ABT2IYS5_9FLAO|nr:hypothetical protein [Chryseobacterium sp. pc1-10]MCT2563977.1 hypothetical protein [Chryseobacterium sp. pc1-10]
MIKETPYEFYNDKLGIKIKYLISDCNKHEHSLCLLSYRAFKKRMDSLTSGEKQLRRASIGYEALVDFRSLSQEWQDLITVTFGNPPEKVKENFFAKHYFTDNEALSFFKTHRYGERNEKYLDDETVLLYTYNASILNTVLKLKADRKGMKKALGSTTMDIWDSLSRDVNSFTLVHHNLPKNKDALRRKTNEYQKNGFTSLISGKLQNNNARKVATDEQTALIDELLSKHNNFDNEIICTMYNAVAKQLNWKNITSGTIANRKKERDLVVFAGRNGVSALRNTILMQNKRRKPSAPLLFWTLDGWDVELLYQKTDTNKNGHSVTTYNNRLNAVIVLDPYNYHIVGYAIGTHETPELIKSALQNAQNHICKLFGDYYKPYQIQTDNYGRGALKPTYESVCTVYTPAQVKNAKSKVIEPWFSRFNNKYCKMQSNWSGYNVTTGSKNQPNAEFLNKIKHSFPDLKGCIRQIENMIEADRKETLIDFMNGFDKIPQEFLSTMSKEYFLDALGNTTGYTNKLQPDGVTPTILGEEKCYDSFDLNFRMLSHINWTVKFDPHNLNNVLAVSEDGKHKFLLQEKYMPSMALADRMTEDSAQLKKVKDFNKYAEDYIIEERAKNANVLQNLFEDRPELNDTLAKMLLTDSLGQHKNQKSKERLQIEVQTEKVNRKIKKQEETINNNSWLQEQNEYLNNKLNLEKYLQDE